MWPGAADGAAARVAAVDAAAAAAAAAQHDAFSRPAYDPGLGGVRGQLADKRWADYQAQKAADVASLRALDALRRSHAPRASAGALGNSGVAAAPHGHMARDAGSVSVSDRGQDGSGDDAEDDDDTDDGFFLRAYRETRLAALRAAHASAAAAATATTAAAATGGVMYGELETLGSAQELPPAVDSVPRSQRAVLLLHERSLPASVAVHAALAELARAHPATRMLVLPVELAGRSFDPIALPALVVYAGGDVVATLLRVHEAAAAAAEADTGEHSGDNAHAPSTLGDGLQSGLQRPRGGGAWGSGGAAAARELRGRGGAARDVLGAGYGVQHAWRQLPRAAARSQPARLTPACASVVAMAGPPAARVVPAALAAVLRQCGALGCSA